MYAFLRFSFSPENMLCDALLEKDMGADGNSTYAMVFPDFSFRYTIMALKEERDGDRMTFMVSTFVCVFMTFCVSSSLLQRIRDSTSR